ncbi:hypothetical protein sscle_01g003900 [Sclerotinia sclerotiorum 1980 UF-70]|uniref:Uncharacterized protein n=1 Tax=Sclerotinia sclerotiorum (strain ATCC 18683 / 1980 / Ss-1) TaxID=665079 RepID=A0A1D9PSI2_SCLS1|nr:hypothetical protein sscle_01g003900 [Sclerotinia sclerotiorum 1980 UF-70]
MCGQYLTHVAIDGGEPLDEEGLAAPEILARMMEAGPWDTTAPEDTMGYAAEYALDGGDRL